MKANYKPIGRSEARRIAREEMEQYKFDVFSECAAEILQQSIAAVLITLEKYYGWKRQRLTEFMKSLQMYLDTMQEDGITGKWDNDENIEYLKDVFGIDIRTEFQAEVMKGR
jgi:hypothetical protein